ncbi:MAG: efflux RND transporter periplasmic adaptor subunit [Pseudomonadota bacterium]
MSVASALQDKVTEWDEFVGRFAAVNQIEIRSRVSGEVQSLGFTDGQMVEKDQVLFVIDPKPYELALNAAKADLEQARARLVFATSDLKRAQNLFKRNNISEQAVDERVEAKRAAEASVAAGIAAVETAELNLSYTQIRSPISGRIDRHLPSVGNLITAGANGTLLTTVVSLDPIHFYFDANEAAYLNYAEQARDGERPSSRVAPNPVELELITETGFPHSGKMDFVGNVIDQQTGTVRGRAIFENSKQVFIPGMFGRLRLRGRSDVSALLLPDAAIGTDQTSRYVMVVNAENIAQPKRIEIGQMYKGLRIVRSGLEPGDKVIVNGLLRARPGSKVTPKPVEVSYPQMPAGPQAR